MAASIFALEEQVALGNGLAQQQVSEGLMSTEAKLGFYSLI